MLIGITYDLKSYHLARGLSADEVAELDEIETIDAIASALRKAGHRADPIGALDVLARRLAQGERWDLVFNIAEGVRGSCRESQAPALMEAFGQPFTGSSALALAVCHHKPDAKLALQAAGLATPPFAEIRRPEDLDAVRLPFPLFVKPAAEGSGKGVRPTSRVESPEALRREALDLLERYRQPVLVESYLPGDEYTVAVLGTGRKAEVLGVLAVDFVHADSAGIYSMHTKTNYRDLVRYRVASGPAADAAARLALAAHRRLDCRDVARHDVRCDAAGVPHFLEVNPLPGLHPETSDLPILCGLLDFPYDRLIGRIVDSAAERLEGEKGMGTRE